MTRTVGILLLVASAVACLIVGALLAAGLTSGSLEAGGAILGFGLAFVVLIAPLAGGGTLVLVRSRQEQAEESEAEALREILDMVEARGQVSISDVIIELKSDLPSVKDMLYKLVGMGLFSGYINWDEGLLYSADASALREGARCKYCGGEMSFGGKGILRCPFCGTEYFLSQ